MIVDDRRAECGHVHAQLVLATGDRLQPVMPGTRAALDDVDERLAVGLAIDLAHAEERLATDEPRAVDVRECEPRQRRRQCLVGLRSEEHTPELQSLMRSSYPVSSPR